MQVATPKKGYKFVMTSFGKYEEIPEEWGIEKFKDFVSLKHGFAFSSNDFIDSNGIKIIKIGDIQQNFSVTVEDSDQISIEIAEKNNEFSIVNGDILMALTGATLGKTGIVSTDEKLLQNQRVGNIFPTDDRILDKKFLFFMLISEYIQNQIWSFVSSSAQPNIGKSELDKIVFFKPKRIEEQQQIVSILSNVDDTIQKTDQIIEQTQRLKKGMMQKLLTRGIGHTKFKKVKWYFGKEIEIPEEWELVKLDNVCSMITDGAHNSPKPVKNGYYFASVENIKNSQIDVESCTKISKNDYDYLVKGNCQPKKEDVLFSKDGTVGVSFVFQQNTDLVLLSSIAIIRTKSSFDSFFCNYSLQSEFLKKHLYSFVGGTGLKRIILKDIKNYQFPLPPLPEQQQIASILSNIDTQIGKEKIHKSNLERLKKGLMQKLLTGQIRVKV